MEKRRPRTSAAARRSCASYNAGRIGTELIAMNNGDPRILDRVVLTFTKLLLRIAVRAMAAQFRSGRTHAETRLTARIGVASINFLADAVGRFRMPDQPPRGRLQPRVL